MSDPPQPSEYQLGKEIQNRLSALGLNVQVDVPEPRAGVRFDVLAETPGKKRIIIETKAGPLNPVRLEYSIQQLEKYRRATNSEYAFVVVGFPQEGYIGHPSIVDVSGLERAIKDILAEEMPVTFADIIEDSKVLVEKEVPTLFVAMPFDPRFYDTFEVGIVEAAKETGFVCDRLDREILDDLIIEEMHQRIHRCVGFVADVTGANPNVMYELGYAKALNKHTVIISATRPEELPFDIRGWQTLSYDLGQTKRLQKELVPRFRRIGVQGK